MKTMFGSSRIRHLKGAGIFLLVAALMTGTIGCPPDDDPPPEVTEITTWHELDAIRQDLGGHYVLMNDLDATTAGYADLTGPAADRGQGWQPIGTDDDRFTGSFDGQGYEISGLVINRPDEDDVGLFGSIREGIIKNVGVVEADVTGRRSVGVLVGQNWLGTVGIVGPPSATYSTYSCGSVHGTDDVGGLVGRNNPLGTVSQSKSSALVSHVSSASGETRWRAGGLVGANYGRVVNCIYNGDVEGHKQVGGLVGLNYYPGKVIACGGEYRVTGEQFVGGMVGLNSLNGMVFGCSFTGAVNGQWVEEIALTALNEGTATNPVSSDTALEGEYIGGLVGKNEGHIESCYAGSSVTGHRYVGGLVGYNDSEGTISSSFAAARVEGEENAGGLVGDNAGTVGDDCFWDMDASGMEQSAGGTGLLGVDMKNIATYLQAGWDICAVADSDQRNLDCTWNIVDGKTYPFPSGKVPEELPDPDPVRKKGAWVDEIVISQEKSTAAAVRKLQDGDTHIFGFGITDPELFGDIDIDPNVTYALTVGGSSDFMFNITGPTFATGELNPFYSARIREATQWIIDRDFIVEEIMGGLGTPKYTQFATTGAEAARYPHIVDPIIEYYAYDFEKGRDIIHEEMENLGADLVDGKWHFEGDPVVARQIIRLDLDPYPEAGDYFADILEDVGFTVERLYRESPDAWAILQTPAADGGWNVYGGGWGMPAVFRTEVHSWRQFNTHAVMPQIPWAHLEPYVMADWPEVYETATALAFTDFANMAEREALVAFILPEARRFANQIWTVERADAVPYRAEIDALFDAAGGVSMLFAQTVHFKDAAGNPVRGGSLSMELTSVMVQPWNPVDGSPMAYDIMVTRDFTADRGVAPHVRTGLNFPQRIERAEVTVKTGLPVALNPGTDWVTLDFADEIITPADAWADWDAENQVWITAAEREQLDPDYTRSANRKSVVYYPADLWDWTWHDGSNVSMGDFMMSWIVDWDRGKEASPMFDPAEKADVEAALTRFKGFKVLSKDPLTVAVWHDAYALDAEHCVSTMWPGYGTYIESAPWHSIAIGKLAEKDLALAFSSSKAYALGVEHMDYTKGPSLPILRARLNQALDATYIPYEPTMGDYVGWMEAEDRYQAITDWYNDKGHFWVSIGPFYLEEVFPIAKIVVLKAFDDYPDESDKWFWMFEN